MSKSRKRRRGEGRRERKEKVIIFLHLTMLIMLGPEFPHSHPPRVTTFFFRTTRDQIDHEVIVYVSVCAYCPLVDKLILV